MPRCEQCGNDYDKPIEITMRGEKHIFDSFECAITALAPSCKQCGCRILGHGAEADGQIFCCANCAQLAGVTQMQDRV